jgi:glyoxylase-like metal-dependent hydrolase (beta-lactamase superfamily II)
MDHRRREPAPGILRLVLRLPFEGLRFVNAYVLAGDADATLVDCGIRDPSSEPDHGWDDLSKALGAAGVRIADVTRLTVTHPHADHYGMAGRIVDTVGCELAMHEAASGELDAYRDPSAGARRLRALLESHGIGADDTQGLIAFEDWRPYISGVVEASRHLSDGDTLTAGTRAWTIVHTPGHSRAHVCLWSEADRILISGDHLLPGITPHIDIAIGDADPLGDYLASLERIEELEPALVLPGHGRPFEDGTERARATLRHHERRLGAVLQVLRREPKTAGHVSDEIFGTALLDFQRRLAVGEALAHIAYLERRGEIESRQRDDGVRLFVKAARRAE